MQYLLPPAKRYGRRFLGAVPPAQTIPIMPFTAASSTYSPSRPMWFDCTIPTTATFCVRAFSMATSIAYFAAT